ncbi:MAG: hypothetical protein H0V89_02180 [Deltaproteobacteria bacterium]|nr:hypothetical protein [Deltaproteobacteria bacterium]
MKRLLQSGFGIVLLGLLVVLGLFNTAQLHNLEGKVARLESSGVRVTDGTPTAVRVAPAGAQVAGATCYETPEDEAALADPSNLLDPFAFPPNWPERIERGGTFPRLLAQDPPGLHLVASNNAVDTTEIYKYVTSRVAYQLPHDPDHYAPDLATRVTRSDDGKTYDVWLRKGVFWHPPAVDLDDPRHAWLKGEHPLTAHDFAFWLETIQNPQVLGRAAALRNYFQEWEPIEVIDDHHFRVHVKENLFMTRSQVFDMEPLPRWLYQYDEDGNRFDDATWGDKQNTHWYSRKAVGVGMYRFVDWEEGVRMSLERNERYHNTKCLTPNFDRVEMNIIKDQQAWLRSLKTKGIAYTQVQPQQFNAEIRGREPYLGEPGLKLAIHDEASYFYLGWNQTRPLFQDKRVRRALTHAFDRQGLVKNVFAELGAVTSGPFDQANPCYDHSIAPLAYDLEEARRLLAEAEWSDTDGDGVLDKVIDGKKTPFSFVLLTYGSSSEYETLARVYREALLDIGIQMTAQPLEWAAQLKKMGERDFDAFTGAWNPQWDVDLYQIWHSTEADKPGSSNYISFRSEEGDRIAAALRREFDPAKRTALCHSFHALLHEEQPYSFFYQRKRAVLYWDSLNEPTFSKLNPQRDTRLFSFATRPE